MKLTIPEIQELFGSFLEDPTPCRMPEWGPGCGFWVFHCERARMLVKAEANSLYHILYLERR